jgi:hypothetical protein
VQKISAFDVFGRWSTKKYIITERKTNSVVGSKEFSDAFFRNFPNLLSFRDEYNSCVDLFNRLSPTHKTLFFVHVKDQYGRHFDDLNLAELSSLKTWLLSRIK